jgi:GNAT superfamily N-acetyltransferase
MTEEYYTETYITQWKDKDNAIISLWKYDSVVYEAAYQVGVVELAVYKHGEHEGEALVWNLYVDEDHRRKGLARELMDEAHKTSKHLGAKVTTLEWSLKDSPYWVFDWYTRLGYDEKEIGNGYALMKRPTSQQRFH